MALTRDQLLQSAERAVARGKLEQALKDYLRVLDDNPRDIATLNRVGDLYVRMNRSPDSIVYFTRIADYYSRDGFFLKAIAIYKKINKIDPARLEVYDRLADLYHKQGLTQDARSQYQVLADHYLKKNRPDEAIAAYKKMASVDPNDLKIQVKLADLYRTNKQTDQAVMQYGLIGSMLLRRGAHDEAAAVFQKALELSPNDTAIHKNLVRSLIAQKNSAAAIAILRVAPRTADTISLMAEAQLEMGQEGESAASAEQAIALDARHEGARVLLARIRAGEGRIDEAAAAVAPIVEAAVASKDYARAAGLLSPILQAEPAHRATLRMMAQVRDAEGNVGDSARLWLALGREDEHQEDREAAVFSYLRVLSLIPGQPDAAARLSELEPSAVMPGRLQPLAVPEGSELLLDLKGTPEAPSLPGTTAPVSGQPSAVRSTEEQELETLIVEAEVFAKYGLTDKAVERLRALARRRPDLLRARERMVELMAESQNPALRQETETLAEAYREKGDRVRAQELVARFLPATATATAMPLPAPAPEHAAFDEFEIEPGPAPPTSGDSFTTESARLPQAGVPVSGPPVSAAASSQARAEMPASPSESDFVSYEELGSLLEEEMQKAGEVPQSPAPAGAPGPAVDDQNLFADEQQFFNLAEELERELSDEAPPVTAPALTGPEGEASLEEIFREFKRGVEQQLSSEDYETHFNLGIAYKEMGLIDEAIGEFQLASKDARRMVECCSMLGLCFWEKGMPQLAIKWYRKGLDAPGIKESETVGMLYDLAGVYQATGETDLAYKTFLEVFGLNTNYRDVAHRVKDLEAVRKN